MSSDSCVSGVSTSGTGGEKKSTEYSHGRKMEAISKHFERFPPTPEESREEAFLMQVERSWGSATDVIVFDHQGTRHCEIMRQRNYCAILIGAEGRRPWQNKADPAERTGGEMVNYSIS